MEATPPAPTKPRILIIGDGFIGSGLFGYFSTLYPTTITSKDTLDITNPKNVRAFFEANEFDIIIHAAGIKDIGLCEREPQLAYMVNGESVRIILENAPCKKFMYISTDYVFDGSKGAYTENDPESPKTIYGKSKVLGERYTTELCSNFAIIRTSGVYGKTSPWMGWLLNQLKGNQIVECFSNVYNTPTYSSDLASMMDDLIQLDFVGKINLSGSETVNRHQLYTEVCEAFSLDTSLLKPGFSGAFPGNLSLDNSLYRRISNHGPNPIRKNMSQVAEGYED